jgi:aspartyl-tRNA(Asn)/glutamyl-tRNA(Gln) amidotransferase subunit A
MLSIKALQQRYLADPQQLILDTQIALADAISPKAQSVFTQVTADLAMVQAKDSTQRFVAGKTYGPLDGIRVVFKDLFDQQGLRTTAASATRSQITPAVKNCLVAEQLENAGMLSIGRTNLSEFAFSGLGINPHFGTPAAALNAQLAMLPGGSSSGSAVAVGLGLASIGMATDTSGSVRVPAALNGLYGFRPSTDRYSRSGVFPLSKSLDSVGTIAANFADLLLVDNCLAEVSSRSLAGHSKVIIDIADSLHITWSAAVYTAYKKALRDYESQGYQVKSMSLKAIDQTLALFAEQGTLVAIEARRLHQPLLDSSAAELMDPFVRRRLQSAPQVTEDVYQAYLEQRDTLIRLAAKELNGALLACPTVPEMELALQDSYQADELDALNARLLSATMFGSFLDLTSMAIPLRESAQVTGSIMLCAASGTDDSLLARISELID